MLILSLYKCVSECDYEDENVSVETAVSVVGFIGPLSV